MRRREFLTGLTAALSLAGCGTIQNHVVGAPTRQLTTSMMVDRREKRTNLAHDSMGLSFEQELLSEPDVFTPENGSLVGLMRGLGRGNTLRFGGNSTEFGMWSRDGRPVGKPYDYVLTPSDLYRVREFLEEADWNILYAINLANGNPDRAADEATWASRILGHRLVGFQIGNEPDLYRHVGIRHERYDVEEYAAEWKAIAAAVRGRVGNAVFAGPDIARSPSWIREFRKETGCDLAFLSTHFYSTGPAGREDVSVQSMLDGDPERLEAIRDAAEIADEMNLPIRVTEGNSCSNGGAEGVSDVFASALWGTSQWFDLMGLGYEGFHFHGGKGSRYTPVAQIHRSSGFTARPLYYGMLFCAQALPGALVKTARVDTDCRLREFCVTAADGSLKVILVNQHADADYIAWVYPDRDVTSAKALRLTAAGLDTRGSVMLGGAQVSHRGEWAPESRESLGIDGPRVKVSVPAASAVMAVLS